MGIVKGIIATVAALVILFIVIGLTLPGEAHVERGTTIDAPREAVFTVINDIRMFNEWSPWAGIDPATRYFFTGPAAGEGARMEWQSEHPNVGHGSMEITESVPGERVRYLFDFGQMGQATSDLLLTGAGDATGVTWTFHTEFGNNPVARWYGLFFDAFIGSDYEQGLENLKDLVEHD